MASRAGGRNGGGGSAGNGSGGSVPSSSLPDACQTLDAWGDRVKGGVSNVAKAGGFVHFTISFDAEQERRVVVPQHCVIAFPIRGHRGKHQSGLLTLRAVHEDDIPRDPNVQGPVANHLRYKPAAERRAIPGADEYVEFELLSRAHEKPSQQPLRIAMGAARTNEESGHKEFVRIDLGQCITVIATDIIDDLVTGERLVQNRWWMCIETLRLLCTVNRVDCTALDKPGGTPLEWVICLVDTRAPINKKEQPQEPPERNINELMEFIDGASTTGSGNGVAKHRASGGNAKADGQQAVAATPGPKARARRRKAGKDKEVGIVADDVVHSTSGTKPGAKAAVETVPALEDEEQDRLRRKARETLLKKSEFILGSKAWEGEDKDIKEEIERIVGCYKCRSMDGKTDGIAIESLRLKAQNELLRKILTWPLPDLAMDTPRAMLASTAQSDAGQDLDPTAQVMAERDGIVEGEVLDISLVRESSRVSSQLSCEDPLDVDLMDELARKYQRLQESSRHLESATKVATVRELLEVYDELEHACEEFQDDSKAWNKFSAMTKKFEARLLGLGVTRLKTLGCTFDPRLHSKCQHGIGAAGGAAQTAAPPKVDPGLTDGVIVEEMLSGWVFGDMVVRPALVETTAPVVEQR